MKKVKKFIKSNIKVVIAFILGGIILGTGGVYAATVLSSSSVSYSNTSSKLTSTNVQDAIDEVYQKTDIRKYSNIVSAYTYNSSTCVTGEEDACVKTTCYNNTTIGSCPAGTIIKYKVNDTDIVTFHVMYDNGSTLTMQSQKNTINNTVWINAADYTAENTDGTSCSNTSCNDEGPMTVLVALERATQSWTNVNNQTYTMGTTTFKTNAYTGCSHYNICTTNQYTLSSRTMRARMITVQEATTLGCTLSAQSCPKWMNNYLYDSTSYGGTINDNSMDQSMGSKNNGYWTMNANSSDVFNAWRMDYRGRMYYENSFDTYYGARAVVVVNK